MFQREDVKAGRQIGWQGQFFRMNRRLPGAEQLQIGDVDGFIFLRTDAAKTGGIAIEKLIEADRVEFDRDRAAQIAPRRELHGAASGRIDDLKLGTIAKSTTTR